VNQSRLRVLQARESAIRQVQEEAYEQLRATGKAGDAYRKLLKDLVIQGLLKLNEAEVSILCRKADVAEVKAVISEATSFYQQKKNRQVVAVVDTEHFLSPESFGGVVLSAHKGKIMCINTLEQRLQLAYEQRLPEVRAHLFGSRFL
jgi:V-type H+-transporting ATPase subunit E